MTIIIKSSDCVAVSDHTLKKLFCAHVVNNSRRILPRPVTNDPNLVSNFELSFCHARNAA